MPGPRKTALLQLKTELQALQTLNTQYNNSLEAKDMGEARDRAGGHLQAGLTAQAGAAAALQKALRDYQAAVDADRKATEAYLRGDPTEESWLEEELPGLAKTTQAKAAIYQAAREELADAQRAIPGLQAEVDKWDKADEDFFAKTQKMRKEMEVIQRKILGLERDLKENPSLGRKIKDMFK